MLKYACHCVLGYCKAQSFMLYSIFLSGRKCVRGNILYFRAFCNVRTPYKLCCWRYKGNHTNLEVDAHVVCSVAGLLGAQREVVLLLLGLALCTASVRRMSCIIWATF